MDPRRYRFESSFTLGAPRRRVHEVLGDLEHYGSWWPQVRGVGKLDEDRALVACRSVLPYDLELKITATNRSPALLEVTIDGPITGWARYRLDEPSPGVTSLRFEQEVCAEARWMAVASYVVRPLLVWNHHRMMRGAERGLRASLEAPGQSREARTAS